MSEINLDDPSLARVLLQIEDAVDADGHPRPILDLESTIERLGHLTPIELVFAWAFTCSRFNTGGISVFLPLPYTKLNPAEITKWFDDECDDLSGFRTFGPHTKAGLVPQVQLGNYRVDFVVVFREWYGEAILSRANVIVVECDGHDFHERTKEQAAKDRKRDRALQAQGLSVLRYTGSELWKDAPTCSEETWRFIHRHCAPLVLPEEGTGR